MIRIIEKKVLIILGPTSTGKTDLALRLAKKYNGELVACDSRQIYTGLDIGTGKYPSLKFKVQSEKLKKGNSYWEINGIRIWMYDVVNPDIQYTVADYVRDAGRVIWEIKDRGKLPIVVGGSGLYLKALLEGLPNLAIPVDPILRKKLSRLSLEQLQKKFQKLSPQRWERMNNSDQQNPRRLVRYIELALTDFTPDGGPKGLLRGGFNTLKIGLTAPREVLYKRADERVVDRINQGMIEEAKNLRKKGLSFKRMRQLGLEYGVLARLTAKQADYLEGNIENKEHLIKAMQGEIHGFIRRQLTWFKNPSASSGYTNWFDISQRGFAKNVEKVVTGWYHLSDEA